VLLFLGSYSLTLLSSSFFCCFLLSFDLILGDYLSEVFGRVLNGALSTFLLPFLPDLTRLRTSSSSVSNSSTCFMLVSLSSLSTRPLLIVSDLGRDDEDILWWPGPSAPV
jgi:hypothetical protein